MIITMHTIHRFLIALAFLTTLPGTMQASRVQLVDDLIRVLYKNSDDAALRLSDNLTMKMDRKILETAIAKHGDEVLKAFDEGGYALLKAARTNGDEVISLAGRVPGSTRLIVANPAKAIEWAGKLGDDALRMEMKFPGVLVKHANILTRADIRLINGLPETTATQLGRLLQVADSPDVARKLIDSYRKYGTNLLSRLSTKEILIGAGVTALVLDQAISDIAGNKPAIAYLIEMLVKWLLGAAKWLAALIAVLFIAYLAFIKMLSSLWRWIMGRLTGSGRSKLETQTKAALKPP